MYIQQNNNFSFSGYAKLRHIDTNLRRPSSLIHTSDSDDDRLNEGGSHRKNRGSKIITSIYFIFKLSYTNNILIQRTLLNLSR